MIKHPTFSKSNCASCRKYCCSYLKEWIQELEHKLSLLESQTQQELVNKKREDTLL